MVLTSILADHIPLKQGLRPRGGTLLDLRPYQTRRPYSIKTRIKTALRTSKRHLQPLADHIPLKQGLRPYDTFHRRNFKILADHIPLKQGLRLVANELLAGVIRILADHIPLKQGLRQSESRLDRVYFKISRRPYSIKTRIKTTHPTGWVRWKVFGSQTIFH